MKTGFFARILTALGLATLPAVAEPLTPARDYLATLSERDGRWLDHGEITFPSGQLFIGDPTSGRDQHIETPREAPGPRARLYTFAYDFIWQGDGSKGTQNGIVWIEFSGRHPVRKGQRHAFGADAATIGLGDLEGGQALVDLGERWRDAGKGDSFEFVSPILTSLPYMSTHEIAIPDTDKTFHVISTGTDGGFDAVWLHDADGAVSGILIDIAGRESDQKFIDLLIPE